MIPTAISSSSTIRKTQRPTRLVEMKRDRAAAPVESDGVEVVSGAEIEAGESVTIVVQHVHRISSKEASDAGHQI